MSLRYSLVFAAVAVAACTTNPPTTKPELILRPESSTLFEDEPVGVSLVWPAAVECGNHWWDCSTGPSVDFFITSTTCDGCKLDGVPGGDMLSAANMTLAVTSTDEIIVSATVESGGVTRTATASAHGDREVALHVDCSTVWTGALTQFQLDPNDLKPCGATHDPQDSVILTPSISTVNGSRQPFPFCSNSDCPRKLSQIVVSGASYTWNHFDLVQMTDTAEAHEVTVTAKLADGTIATAQVTTPALIVY